MLTFGHGILRYNGCNMGWVPSTEPLPYGRCLGEAVHSEHTVLLDLTDNDLENGNEETNKGVDSVLDSFSGDGTTSTLSNDIGKCKRLDSASIHYSVPLVIDNKRKHLERRCQLHRETNSTSRIQRGKRVS